MGQYDRRQQQPIHLQGFPSNITQMKDQVSTLAVDVLEGVVTVVVNYSGKETLNHLVFSILMNRNLI